MGNMTSVDLTPYAKKTDVDSKYATKTSLTAVENKITTVNLTGYAKTTDVDNKLASYPTKTDITNAGYAKTADLAPYAKTDSVYTKSQIDNTGYATVAGINADSSFVRAGKLNDLGTKGAVSRLAIGSVLEAENAKLNIQNPAGSWTHFGYPNTAPFVNQIRGSTEISAGTGKLTFDGTTLKVNDSPVATASFTEKSIADNLAGTDTFQKAVATQLASNNAGTIVDKLKADTAFKTAIKGDKGDQGIQGITGSIGSSNGLFVNAQSSDIGTEWGSSVNIKNTIGNYTHFNAPAGIKNKIRNSTSVESGSFSVTSGMDQSEGLSDKHRQSGLNIRNDNGKWTHFNQQGSSTNAIRGNTTVEGALCFGNGTRTTCLSAEDNGGLIMWDGNQPTINNRIRIEVPPSGERKLAWS